MDTVKKLNIVLKALDTVLVSGKKNLDCVLGSMQILEQIIKELEAKANADKNDADKPD